jgi:1,3-propanediol dehydrogenase
MTPPAPAAPGGVIKFQTPEVVFGPESLAEAGFAARRIGAQRPFVVTDPGLIEAGWAGQLLKYLAEVGLQPTVWSGVTPNPKDVEVAEGYQRYLESGCDVIIAIGGGSCIDAAKGIAILIGNGGNILDYAGVDRVSRPIPPLLMIPSTAGTGADVSQFCIITDTASAVKVTIMGRALVPEISVTDPRLLATMPSDLAAATGLDALTHGIEAYVSCAHNPLTATAALFFNPIDPDLLCCPAPRVISCECRENRSASHRGSRAAVDFGSLGYLFVTESDGNNARHNVIGRKVLTDRPISG